MNPNCRICLDFEPIDDLIYPCRCRGSAKYIHRECLNAWRNQNRNNSFFQCNECKYEYRISRLWYASIISHPVTSLISSIGLVTCAGLMAGYCSSSVVNSIWYHSPHRLQILYHACAWIGIPGLYKLMTGGIPINNNAPSVSETNVRAMTELLRVLSALATSNRTEVHHYEHSRDCKEHRDEDKDQCDEKKDEKEKTKDCSL